MIKAYGKLRHGSFILHGKVARIVGIAPMKS